MNFTELRQAGREFDELLPLGITVEREGRVYHIVGIARCQDRAAMYILKENEQMAALSADRRKDHYTNRAGMKIVPAQSYFDQIAAVRIEAKAENAKESAPPFGKESVNEETLTLETEGACSGSLAVGEYYDWESILLFVQMMNAGWRLPEDSFFADRDWKDLGFTKLTFRAPVNKLPAWKVGAVSVRLGKRSQDFLIEKPVSLTVGQEAEIVFTLEDGRSGICYINKVYLMDIWKEQEEKFKDPRYLEIMTEEELEKRKEEFFRGLEQDCPRGMCYLGIEYECTLEGSLVFYDKAFLDAKPKENRGSARVLMILLKPEETVGKHGIRQQGCVVQTPLMPDTERIEAELFQFVEVLPEQEEQLFL